MTVATTPGAADAATSGATHDAPGARVATSGATPGATSGATPGARCAAIARETAETAIRLRLDLDGSGRASIRTGVGFFDHMLHALARHALFDLEVEARGDLEVDCHHTVEDVGIVLGQAIRQALGDKRGVRRYGHACVPMDEALAEAAIDLSGRAFLVWKVPFAHSKIGAIDTELFEEFFRALSANGLFALHVELRHGHNAHHVAEACFKAAARALRQACEPDPRAAGAVPSTKGTLEG